MFTGHVNRAAAGSGSEPIIDGHGQREQRNEKVGKDETKAA